MFERNLRKNLMRGVAGICFADGEGDAGSGGDTGGSGGGGGGDQAGAWTAGLDAEVIGVIQTKGWDKLTPAQAAAQAVQSYREAEKFLGAPRDQLLRKPDAADAAAVRAFWQNFGTPADKTGYDFAAVKFTDGSELDPGFVDFMRDQADALNLPKDAASALAAGFVKFMETADAAEAGERTAAVQADKTALQREWGQNYEAHKFVAQKGAEWAGVSADEFNKLFETPGGAKMLGIFHKIGEMTGEGRYVGPGPGNGNGGLMTREQAAARKATLTQDTAWVTKYNNGDAAALAEMTALNTILTSGVEESDFFER